MMKQRHLSIVWVLVVLMLAPLAGCLSGDAPSSSIQAEPLEVQESPCSVGSSSTVQSMTSITVNGVERVFRLTAPESTPGTALPIVIAFHGGDDDGGDFQQQAEFDQLAEDEKFIMAYAIAEDDRTAAEGEWFLNTAATSREDNDFAEAIVDELALAYCIDEDRLYAIG